MKLQLYPLAGVGRSARHPNRPAVRLHCLHTGVLAVGRIHLHALRIRQGRFDRGVRLHAHRSVERSFLRHR